MRNHSVYAAVCLCGRKFETPDDWYDCPDCKRRIVLQWGYESKPKAPAENNVLVMKRAAA